MSSPRIMALAYRIHGYAASREWDCTIAEIAEALGEQVPSVRATIQWKGWFGRLRVTQRERPYSHTPFVGGVTKLHEVLRHDLGLDE